MTLLVEDIFSAFGGASTLAETLGVTVQAVCNMKPRGLIPPKHWSTIVSAAKDRLGRSDVTPDQAAVLNRITFEALAGMRMAPQARAS